MREYLDTHSGEANPERLLGDILNTLQFPHNL
jgi:hypothetical protein